MLSTVLGACNSTTHMKPESLPSLCSISISYPVTAELYIFLNGMYMYDLTCHCRKRVNDSVYFLSPLWSSPIVYFSFMHYLSVWLSLFHIRDILPFTLKLPEAIHSAVSLSDLHEVAQQGAGTDRARLTHLKYRI